MNNRENTRKQLHIRLPNEIYKKLKLKCVHEDTSMQDYVTALILVNLADFSGERESITKKH
ncbi:unnamed protein product [marine sediment metagenome]|uniref:Uncharacterized protein n=1 Tax=marine sediment metagenome TaxID=412755 RepID=X1NHD2_9ZZZZ